MKKGGIVLEVIVGSAGLGVLCGFILGFGIATERGLRKDARERETQRRRALKGYRP